MTMTFTQTTGKRIQQGQYAGSINSVPPGDMIEGIGTAIGAAFTTAQFGNCGSFVLQPGEYWITSNINVAAGTYSAVNHAVSINSGNTTTDHVLGDNAFNVGLTANGPTSHSFRHYLKVPVSGGAVTVYQKVAITGTQADQITSAMYIEKYREASDYAG